MPKTIFSAGQEHFQKLLREARQGAGLTQEKAAKLLKRPQSFISKIESGERRLDLVELREVCQAYKMPLRKFVESFEQKLGR